MGIAQQLAHNFDEGVRSRGLSYFADNRVLIAANATDTSITSKVKGTVTYRVKINLRGDRLVTSCSCPFFGEEGQPCKHIWATFLAIDAHGLLESAYSRPVYYQPDVRGRDGLDKPGLSRSREEMAMSRNPYEDDLPPSQYDPQDPDTILQRHWDGIEAVPPPPTPPHRPDDMTRGYSRQTDPYARRSAAYMPAQSPPRGPAQRAPQPQRGGRQPVSPYAPGAYGGYGPPPTARYPSQTEFRDPRMRNQTRPQSALPAPQVVHEITAPWEHEQLYIERITRRSPAQPGYPQPGRPANGYETVPTWTGGASPAARSPAGRSARPGDPYSRANGGTSHMAPTLQPPRPGYGPGPGARLPHPSQMRQAGRRGNLPPGAYPPIHPTPVGYGRRPDQSMKARAAANAALSRVNAEPRRPSLFFIIDSAPMLSSGQVVVELGQRRRRTDGSHNERGPIQTWKPSQAAFYEFEKNASTDDLEILDLLAAASEPSSGKEGSDLRTRRAAQAKRRSQTRGHVQYRFTIQPEHTAGMVERLVRTGRCRIRRSESAQEEPPVLRWDEGPAWKFGLDIKSDATGKRWTWRGALRRNDQKMDIAEPLAVLPGLVFSGIGRLGRFDDSSLSDWVTRMRNEKELQLSDTEQDELLAKILEQSKISIDQLTDSTIWSELAQHPTPCLILRTPRQNWGPERLVGEVFFDYGGTRIPLAQASAMTVESQKLRIIHREQEAEADATRLLWELGFRPNTDVLAESGSLELPPKKLNQVVKDLVAFGWFVEAEGKRYRPASEFKLNVSTHIDWFELGGAVSFGGQMVALPALLKAADKGDTTITLPDGTVGVLPEDWLRKYGFLTGLGEADGSVLKFSKNQAALLDSMLASQPEITFDDGFSTARKSLQSFQGITPLDPPDMFHGELRPYQKEGLGWLDYLEEFEFGGVLADDMGLGKTVQVLAQLARWRESGKRKGPSLIIVPRSLVFNWVQEAKRFAPDLRVLEYSGPNRQALQAKFRRYDLIVTTYGTLRSDIVELAKMEFDYVILDEAQAIKNADSLAAKAARLLKGRHRLAMSGTPIENHLGELWSLFEFINPGMLGTAAVFKRMALAATGSDPIARDALGRSLRPFILRRTKKQVVKDLPEKSEQFLHCDLEPEQRAYYDQLREHYRHALLRNEAASLSGGKISTNKIEVLEALLRLRQAACHPGLIDPDKRVESSAKLDILLPHMEEVIEEGHKVLIFSQFTSFLSIVGDRLDQMKIKYEYLDGRTRDREARVQNFQSDPSIPVFLISLKAGGLGLNLTSADYVYLLDPWWNPAVEAQAIDRSHRIGQTQHVFAYRLIARDTVEQKIVDLQAQKRDLADAILGGDNRVIQSLTREDLEYLLS
ncbi:MAG: hypothetical protein RJA81_427 [Planctomycetota bacterium]